MEAVPGNDDLLNSTETSPLLTTGHTPGSSGPKRGNGTFADPEGSASEGDGESIESLANPTSVKPGAEEGREGLPAVAAKLPILIPAIGIGVGPPLTLP